MIFYQSTTDQITHQQLSDAILQNSSPVQIKEFHFKEYLFNGTTTELSYNGIVDISCQIR